LPAKFAAFIGGQLDKAAARPLPAHFAASFSV
jgi:hypothetical protein